MALVASLNVSFGTLRDALRVRDLADSVAVHGAPYARCRRSAFGTIAIRNAPSLTLLPYRDHLLRRDSNRPATGYSRLSRNHP